MENTTSSELTPTKLGFPNEFPYEFDSPAFTPGFTSPGDSTETEDESSDDEEDFLAGLTRRLAPSTQRNTKPEEKRQVTATSPQSTLSGLGSFSNYPTSSFRRDNAWDVISAAAGEVAKLKMSSYESQNGAFHADQSLHRQNAAFQSDDSLQRQNGVFQANHTLQRQNGAFRADQSLQRQNGAFQVDHLLKAQNGAFHGDKLLETHNGAFQDDQSLQNGAFQADQSLQRQRFDQMWLCSQSRIKSFDNHFPKRVMNREASLENLRYIRRNNTISSTATWQPQGTPLKRPSTGTGVFLPRRYPTTTTTPSESYKKPAVNGRVMMQSKVNFDEFNTTGGPRLNQLDYECMITRSRLVAARERNLRSVLGDGCLIQERCLPQDWMY